MQSARVGGRLESLFSSQDSEEVNGNKTKRPQKLAPPCEIPKLLQKDCGQQMAGLPPLHCWIRRAD